MATNIGELSLVMTVDNGKFNASLRDTEGRIYKLNQAMQTSASAAASTGDDYRAKMGAALNSLKSDMGSVVGRLLSIGTGAVKGAILGTAGVIGALGTKGIMSANQLNSLQISMNGLTGSIEKGAEAMATAYKYAQKAPFQLPDVAQTTKGLIAMGVETKNVGKALESIGGVAITSGAAITDIGRIYGQVFATGKLQLEDMNQLTDNGVGIQKQLEKQLGKTGEEVRKMATDGKISFADFEKAMASLVDPKILDQLNNTLPRQIDRLKGSVRILSNAFVGVSVNAEKGFTMAQTSLAQITTTATKNLADLLRAPQLTAGFGRLGESLAKLATTLSKSINIKAIADASGTALNKVAALIDRINTAAQKGGAKGAFEQLKKEIQGVANALNLSGIGEKLASSVFGGLSKINLAQHAAMFTSKVFEFLGAIDWAGVAAQSVGLIITVLPQIIDGIIMGLLKVAVTRPLDMAAFILAIGFLPAKMLGALTGILARIPIVGPVLNFLLNGFKAATTAAFPAIGNAISWVMGGVVGRITSAGGNVFNAARTAFINMAPGLSSTIGTVVGAAGRLIGSLFGAFSHVGPRAWAVAAAIGNSIINAISGFNLFNSGAALINGFLNGIASAFNGVKNFVRDKLSSIRRLFPFSPAKEGPFSGRGYTTYSGRALMTDFGRGILEASVGVSGMANKAMGGIHTALNDAVAPGLNISGGSVALAPSGMFNQTDQSAGRGSGNVYNVYNNVNNEVDATIISEKIMDEGRRL